MALKKSYIVGLLLVGLGVVFSCNKETKPQPISPIPNIILVSLSPSKVTAFKDSLTFRIHYQDGDGDLGTSKRDEYNLFIQDSRLPNDKVHQFRISQLAPDNAKVPIEGNLNVVLKNILLTDSVATQETQFTVWMKDRAGNQSNKFSTYKIAVNK